MGSAAKIRSKFENLRREIKADLKGSSMTCQRKDQSLAINCTIDARSLAFYIIKASDCANLRYYTSYVFHIFSIILHPWTVLQLLCFIFSASTTIF